MPLTNLAERHTLPHVKIRWTKLPFFFDPARLRADLNAIPNSAWVPHFNQNDYTGQWSSVALRSLSGRADDIQPRGHTGQFINTPLAASCPNLERVIDTFAFPKKSVRLLRLHARSRVLEHRDPDLGLVDGEIRIHVPITTNDRLEFVVANRQLLLARARLGTSTSPSHIASTMQATRTAFISLSTARSMTGRSSFSVARFASWPPNHSSLTAFEVSGNFARQYSKIPSCKRCCSRLRTGNYFWTR